MEVSRNGDQTHVEDTRCDLDDTYRDEIIDFLDAVADGRLPRTPAHEGVAAVELAAAIARSSSSGSREVL